MKKYLSSLILPLIFSLLAGCAHHQSLRTPASESNEASLVYFTTDSLVQNLDEVDPEVRIFLMPGGPFDKHIGLMGATGVLSQFGPFGNRYWQPTAAFRSLGNWQDFQEYLTSIGGPLSENGPYSLTTEAHGNYLSFLEQFAPRVPGYNSQNLWRSLRAGGALHVLGDSGNMSPLSIAGPGGPNGATGLEQDGEGNFIDRDGQVVSDIEVDLEEGKWKAPLSEIYTNNSDNHLISKDSFFARLGEVTRADPTDQITFTSNRSQWLSILLIADYTLDNFELTLRPKGKDTVIATTSNRSLSNFIVIKVPAGTEFDIDVKLKSSGHILPKKSYRLFVNGSTERAKSVPARFHKPYSAKALSFASRVKDNCYTLVGGLLK